MPFFWEFSYPAMFQAKIDPATGTLTITPQGNSFKGIVSIAVFESINCGDGPVCAYEFSAPVSGQVQLPEGFLPCALDASPLFLKLCWRRRVEFPSLQMAAVAW